MKTAEMREILFKKLQDEETNFSKSEISIKKNRNNTYTIVIKGYEHIPFTMSFEEDDYFGFIVYVKDEFEERNIIFVDSKEEYRIDRALIQLGYYIGTRF